jgi:hypothetical protein
MCLCHHDESLNPLLCPVYGVRSCAVEDESAAAEPALVDALSWSALEFALNGSLRSCR